MTTTVTSPLQGMIVSIEVSPGDSVGAGAVLFLVESMKMHHDVVAPEAATVTAVLTTIGATVNPGQVLAQLDPVSEISTGQIERERSLPPADVVASERTDLAEAIARHRVGSDE